MLLLSSRRRAWIKPVLKYASTTANAAKVKESMWFDSYEMGVYKWMHSTLKLLQLFCAVITCGSRTDDADPTECGRFSEREAHWEIEQNDSSRFLTLSQSTVRFGVYARTLVWLRAPCCAIVQGKLIQHPETVGHFLPSINSMARFIVIEIMPASALHVLISIWHDARWSWEQLTRHYGPIHAYIIINPNRIIRTILYQIVIIS